MKKITLIIFAFMFVALNADVTYKVKLLKMENENIIVGNIANIEKIEKITTCKTLKEKGVSGSGKYIINPTGNEEVEVYCEMETDGGGWTLFFYSNLDSVSVSDINNNDWLSNGTDINFSYLYSFKNIKNINERYEFFIHDSSDIFRNIIFSQTNSYLEDPVGNDFTQTGGNFYYSNYATGWRGLSLGKYGENHMQEFCTLSMANYGSSWTYCLQDHFKGYAQDGVGGYGTAPWFYNSGYDVGSQKWVKIYQR